MVIDDIQDIIRERGSALNRDDLARIAVMAVDVPLKDSEALASLYGAIALIVNDPEYDGDIAPIE